ncbi:hypothetical protein FKM82_008973 [Ascaphus truei]
MYKHAGTFCAARGFDSNERPFNCQPVTGSERAASCQLSAPLPSGRGRRPTAVRPVIKGEMDFYIANSSRPGLGGGNECGDGTYVQCLPVPPAKQLLEMPLGVKLPILPGSEVMLYTTHLAEKVYN